MFKTNSKRKIKPPNFNFQALISRQIQPATQAMIGSGLPETIISQARVPEMGRDHGVGNRVGLSQGLGSSGPHLDHFESVDERQPVHVSMSPAGGLQVGGPLMDPAGREEYRAIPPT